MTTAYQQLVFSIKNPADNSIRFLLVFSSEFFYTLEEPSSQQVQQKCCGKAFQKTTQYYTNYHSSFVYMEYHRIFL